MKRKHYHSFLAFTTGCCFASLVWCNSIFSQNTVPVVIDSQSVNFVQDIAPLFERRCAGCHEGERAKAGFEIDNREEVMGFIEPGDTENSSLWTDYLTAVSAHADPETTVMPMNGPLPKNELEILDTWIQEGANWPEKSRFIRTAGIPTIERESGARESLLQRISAFIGYFHPAIVHFPIALLIFGGASAALSFVTGGRAIYVAFYCLVWGTLLGVVTAMTGWSLADEKGYPAWSTLPTSESIEAAAAVFRHRWLGTFATILAIVVLGIAIYATRNPKSQCRYYWRAGMIVLALTISIVGHQGGELVYGDILGKALGRLIGK